MIHIKVMEKDTQATMTAMAAAIAYLIIAIAKEVATI